MIRVMFLHLFLWCCFIHLTLAGKLLCLGCSELQSCPHSRVLVFPLQCSRNMLEGGTGYAHILYHKKLLQIECNISRFLCVVCQCKVLLNNSQYSCSLIHVLTSATPLIWALVGSIYGQLQIILPWICICLWNLH